MAPEVLENIEYDAEKADCFSLGIILFIMAFKNLPFDNANEGDKLWKALNRGMFSNFWNL